MYIIKFVQQQEMKKYVVNSLKYWSPWNFFTINLFPLRLQNNVSTTEWRINSYIQHNAATGHGHPYNSKK